MITHVPEPSRKPDTVNLENRGMLSNIGSKAMEFMIGTKNAISALISHGIPLELSITGLVTPDIQDQVMLDYKTQLGTWKKQNRYAEIQSMLVTLDKNFPTLVAKTLYWTWVRAHFFGKIKYWGKFG